MTLRMIEKDLTQEEWNGLTAPFADLSLMQTWAYGAAKRAEGWRVARAVFEEGGDVVGLVQAMVKPLPFIGGGLVWINRGPLWRKAGEAGDPARLAAMLGLIRSAWGGGRYLRVAPACEVAICPEGYRDARRLGWASAKLDLTVGEDALRQGLKQKWRNVLNKAERSDVAVSVDDGEAAFAAFQTAHADFMIARGFGTSLTPDFLGHLRAAAPGTLTVLAARDGKGVVLGAALIGRYGDTVEYLAGNVTDEGRREGVGQLLLWRAIVAARGAGARVFDLGGQDEARTPDGILKFKQGVNGAPYRLCGEIEARSGLVSRLVRARVAKALAAAD